MAKEAIYTYLEPFCRGGELYYVGTKEENCHVIRTREGLIMIDVGSEANLPFVLDGMKAMGLPLEELRIVLLSHWHNDHVDGYPLLLRECRKVGGEPKVYIGERDEKHVKFQVDGVLRDGDVISLGGTDVLCLSTPGHTEGTTSFFFDIHTAGKTVRCGMFGGAGTNQLRTDFLFNRGISRLERREFMKSIERLEKIHVDMRVGNHSWNDSLPQNYAIWKERGFDEYANPFIDAEGWQRFLSIRREDYRAMMKEESVTKFVNYAHRGRSDVYPGNTMPAFLAAISACANGIETDVRRTADGVPVLFHDETPERLGLSEKTVSEVTFGELDSAMRSAFGEEYGCVTAENFLRVFGRLGIRLALELKEDGLEEDLVGLVAKYAKTRSVTFTSFELERLEKLHALSPNSHLGYLVGKGCADVALCDALFERGIEEVCPHSSDVTPELVTNFHDEGFTVRAWGVGDESEMKRLVDAGADGMTVDFPQKLAEYLEYKKAQK